MNIFDLHFASLGFGNMQKGIMQKLFDKKVIDKNKYIAIVHRPESREKLEKNGLKSTLDHAEIMNADVIFLAYKQDGFWAEEIYENMNEKIVISIIAGITTEDVAKKFIGADIIQAMPNRGSVVGEGCTFLKFSENISDEKKELVKEIFAESGDVYEVKNTEELNKGILISASMFGVIAFLRDQIHDSLKLAEKDDAKSRDFFIQFEEIATDLAQKYNFLPQYAEKIVTKTFFGVEALAEKFKYADVQASVTSKNGITHAMIEYLKSISIENFLRDVFTKELISRTDMTKKFAKYVEQSCDAGLMRAQELAEE